MQFIYMHEDIYTQGNQVQLVAIIPMQVLVYYKTNTYMAYNIVSIPFNVCLN